MLAGLRIYAITKGVGHEITRVFAENHRHQLRVLNVVSLHTPGIRHSVRGAYIDAVPSVCVHMTSVRNLKVSLTSRQLRYIVQIFNGFYNPEPSSERRFDGTGAPGGDTQVMAISWPDAGRLLHRFSL